jgi:pimeloyl-ACP methyl ester carboxylesterase
VTPLLASAGFRVVVPYVRGYGTTRFLSNAAFRNGQQSVLGVDVIALMDALGIQQAVVGGFAWGARTADVMAALWPDRCTGLVSVSGYLIGSQAAGGAPLPPAAEHTWWYQYYFATERGRAGYDAYRRDFNKLIWRFASPQWDFDEATFTRSAAAFDNPDHVAIVIHNYRWRLGLAPGEPRYANLERRLAGFPAMALPTITLEGDANGAPHPRPQRLRQQIHRQVCTPDNLRRRRPQPAPRGAGSFRGGRRRRQPLLTSDEHPGSAAIP